ncbi:MAG: ABC transporter substrate-binding protein [Beijerinckiaceae bacterium]|nr:ABC transporter substrate-binding protein [Beijerinckiaceae bacterium]
MNRRTLLRALGAAAAMWPAASFAQPARRTLIGLLFHSNPEPSLTLLRTALANLGYREGETLQIDIRVANGSDAKLKEMAADLVARQADAIVAFTTPAALAAKAATDRIPIVMAGVADAVGSGLVTSLARPGGNVTGVSAVIAELSGTLLGMLREVVPAAARIGVLVNTADPFHLRMIDQIETANRTVKIDLGIFRVARPGEIAAAFEEMAARKIEAAIIQPTLPRAPVIELAIKARLPTASAVRGYAEDGGLLAYGGKLDDIAAIAAGQVERVLKGARPADIPVQQPAKFELLFNAKTARAIGVTIPPAILARADEVIE